MRFKIIKFCYFAFILLIVIRLWYWQVLKSDDLVARAESQRLSSTEVLAPRGDIKFSDGSILVSSQPIFLVYAQPKLIKDKKAFAKEVADIFLEVEIAENQRLNKDATVSASLDDLKEFKAKRLLEIYSGILDKINQDLYWVNLGKRIDYNTKLKLENLNLSGVGFDQLYSRFYPEGSSSAHILGFVGSDSYGNDIGYFGIEGYYNGELKGKIGLVTEEKDAQGAPILIGKFISRDPKEGKTLILNIDRVVQHIVEEKLKIGLEKYGAMRGSAIVMDPKTGAVLAMASYPNYDPALPAAFPREYYKNPLTTDAYEPGSTFKVLVMASAINEGLVKPDTKCDICSGPISLGGFTIRTWNNQYMDNLTMTDVIIHSDNTGMVFVSKKLGVDKLYNYLNSFGFGQSSGIDVQDESYPTIRSKESFKDIDLATASFGQGISVTAIQLIKAVSAIANGGYVMEPHVISSIFDGVKSTSILPRVLSQPISKESAKQITEMMVRAVEEGEAKFARTKGFKVAGKTGTAQIPIEGHYDPNKTIASFIGFAPADDPKFIMLVRYDHPTSSIYGAETAAPTFFDIARELFTYYGIPPSE